MCIDDVVARRFAVRTACERVLDGVVDLVPWRSGADFHVDLVLLAPGTAAAVKYPKVDVLDTTYEGAVDYRLVIEKEARLLDALAARTLVPDVLAWSSSEDHPPFVAMQLLPDHQSDALDAGIRRELGRACAAIHHTPLAEISGVVGLSNEIDIADRIDMRLVAASQYCDFGDLQATRRRLKEAFEQYEWMPARLLHMDLRPPNVCTWSGALAGLIDFSNAIVADPILEYAQLALNGLLDEEFLNGYGPIELDESIVAALQLDTSCMLTVAAMQELDDQALFDQMRGRAEMLARKLP